MVAWYFDHIHASEIPEDLVRFTGVDSHRRRCHVCSQRYYDSLSHYYRVSPSMILGFCRPDCLVRYLGVSDSESESRQASLDTDRFYIDYYGRLKSGYPSRWYHAIRCDVYRYHAIRCDVYRRLQE